MEKEQLFKSLGSAIDAAMKTLVDVEALSKSETSLQDAKLRPETANGTLPGVSNTDGVLTPEDAKKGENPFADKDKDADKKKDHKEPDGDEDDEDDDEDMDDKKAAKMKAKIKKYEDEKEAASAGLSMSKADIEEVSQSLTKSMVAHVENLQKSFSDRLTQLEGLINKVIAAPQPRQSVSGLAPLAKSNDDVGKAPISRQNMVNQLCELQKTDNRVDSTVITRVEMGDYSVLSERGINLK